MPSTTCISFQDELTRIKDKITSLLRKKDGVHSELTEKLIRLQSTSRDLQETLEELRSSKLGV